MNKSSFAKKVLIFLYLVFSQYLYSQSDYKWIAFWNYYHFNDIVSNGNDIYVATNRLIGKIVDDLYFTPVTRESMETFYFTSLEIDKNGDLWAGSPFFGITHFTSDSFEVFRKDNSPLPTDRIYDIECDEQNNLWIGTNSGLAQFDGSHWTVFDTSNSPLPSNIILKIFPDRDNVLWFGTDSGLVKKDGNTWTIFNKENSLLPGNVIYSIESTDDGILWIGTSDGLARFDGSSWEIFNTTNSDLPDDHIYCLAIDQQRNIWIGTENGLAIYDGSQFIVEKFSEYYSDYINAILVDNFGRVWVSVSYIGLFNYQNFKRRKLPITVTSHYWSGTYCASFDQTGIVWLGSDKSILSFDGTEWQIYNENNVDLLSPYRITDVEVDQMNNKWFGSFYGIYKLDGNNWVKYDTSNTPLTDDGIYDIEIDKNDAVWIATENDIFKFDNNQWTKVTYENYDSFNFRRILKSDNKGNIWLGCESELAKFSNGKWITYNLNDINVLNLKSHSIHDISIDNNDNVWISTSDDLIKFDGKNWTNVKVSVPGVLDSIDIMGDIEHDSEGNLWAIINYWLCKFDGSSWEIVNPSEISVHVFSILKIDPSGNKWIIGDDYILVYNEQGPQFIPDISDPNISQTILLRQNYPNPFNSRTQIPFTLMVDSPLKLSIFDILGRKIKTQYFPLLKRGDHTIEVNFENLPSGIYFYNLKSGKESKTGKMILVK